MFFFIEYRTVLVRITGLEPESNLVTSTCIVPNTGNTLKKIHKSYGIYQFTVHTYVRMDNELI